MENDDNFVAEYLNRINVPQSDTRPDKRYLIQVHIGHLTHIPFETFDLIDLKELDISPNYIFNRLIKERRGGVCFQHNGILEMLLRKLNFKSVQMIPCCVFNHSKNKYGDFMDHLALCVTLEDGTKLLCDVGFSRNFLSPLLLECNVIQFATSGFFRLTKTENDEYYELERGFLIDGNYSDSNAMLEPETIVVDIDPQRIKWVKSYRFPVKFAEMQTKLEDFRDTCHYILHSPDCILNHLSICRMEQVHPFIGAYTIVGKELVEYKVKDGVETQTRSPISDDDEELKTILKDLFNLEIERKLSLVAN